MCTGCHVHQRQLWLVHFADANPARCIQWKPLAAVSRAWHTNVAWTTSFNSCHRELLCSKLLAHPHLECW